MAQDDSSPKIKAGLAKNFTFTVWSLLLAGFFSVAGIVIAGYIDLKDSIAEVKSDVKVLSSQVESQLGDRFTGKEASSMFGHIEKEIDGIKNDIRDLRTKENRRHEAN